MGDDRKLEIVAEKMSDYFIHHFSFLMEKIEVNLRTDFRGLMTIRASDYHETIFHLEFDYSIDRITVYIQEY